jgi:hypothetical protein
MAKVVVVPRGTPLCADVVDVPRNGTPAAPISSASITPAKNLKFL